MDTATREDALSQVPLFAELSKTELRSISGLMTPITVPAGRQLIREGQFGREFLVLIDGKATVTRQGEFLANISSGDFVGEMSLVTGDPCNATVVADSDSTLAALNRREFTTLLDKNPGLVRNILTGAIRRLQTATELS